MVSFLLNTFDEHSANLACMTRVLIYHRPQRVCTRNCTCVATYAIDARVTQVMPCIRAFPDLVALASRSTELGDVKICLNV